ncbi:MAG: AAA family ATPase, partial [Clostridia bacterium]|nr:AAA family ATPase [Clostridia bacterium]
MERKLPIGVQDFEKIITKNFLYVDKTKLIYQLFHEGTQCFLSRPRRFGKSLLLSTIKAYAEGKRELFRGLEIEKLEQAWTSYPVFYFDFNGANYLEQNALEEMLGSQLKEWEERYFGGQRGGDTLSERFQTVLRRAYEQMGHRCVVLVDEYDKPLLDVVDNPEMQEHNKAVFKGFFSTLKRCDAYIEFVFITGVTKFHKVSIFSDLNQLNDISLNEDYAGVCGITQEEILQYFSPEVERLAKRRNLTHEECMHKLQEWYDGYHFNASSEGVYNPFSLLKAFYEKSFGSYWFATGTPTFLVKKLKETSFDVRKFSDQTINANDSVLMDYTGESIDPVPLLYQTGYLTIAGCDERRSMYTLSFPNREVKYGFLESMVREY